MRILELGILGFEVLGFKVLGFRVDGKGQLDPRYTMAS